MEIAQPYYCKPEFSQVISDISGTFARENDLSIFVYSRVYDNGTCIYFSSIPGFQKFLFDRRVPVTASIPADLQKKKKFWYLIEENLPRYSQILRDVKEIYNLNAPIDYIVRSTGFYEMYCFASQLEFGKAANRYLNRLERMEAFSKHFKDLARDLISTAESARMTLPKEMLSNISGLSRSDNQTVKEPFGLNTSYGLSKREQECVFGLLNGKTAKQIAAELNLSPRTIEFYFANLKSKLGCYKKSDILVRLFQKSHLI